MGGWGGGEGGGTKLITGYEWMAEKVPVHNHAHTVEPLNNGHIGGRDFVLYTEVDQQATPP